MSTRTREAPDSPSIWSGLLLLLAALVALVWANSPWSATYFRLLELPVGFRVGDLTIERTSAWLVNDGLMSVFFFVVSMEIRRELREGVLSSWRRAALPAIAALGGMIAPAILYLVVAPGSSTRAGWGVPIATDIAFAMAVLALLGRRVPPALRIVLLALAIIDDLGAIVVIAIFYSSGIALSGLVVAALGVALLVLLPRLGVTSRLVYLAAALVLWVGVLRSGIHPTIAGVILGLLVPGRKDRLAKDGIDGSESPASRLTKALQPWVSYGIMPLFALANAGIELRATSLDPSSSPVIMAVALGLIVGKPLGVWMAIWIAVRLRIGTLPDSLTMRPVVVLGMIAGVGFTMSIFIAQLAFGDARHLAAAKLGVVAASAVAAAMALVLGRILLSPPPRR